MFQGPYYTLFKDRNNASVVTWEFQLNKNRFFPPTLLEKIDFPESLQGVSFQICGMAPVWMYLHVAYWAVLAGVKTICVFQPGLDKGVQVFPLSNHGSTQGTWFKWEEKEDRILFSFRVEKKMPENLLRIEPFSFPPRKKPLIIGGRGSNWMYAAAGVTAANSNFDDVLMDAPQWVKLFHVGKIDCGKESEMNTGRDLHGKVIGIVGDPNSGKSVFAKILGQQLLRLEKSSEESTPPRTTWVCDCDAASPTSNWYLEMLQAGKKELADSLRKEIKKKWTHEDEIQMADRLNILKQNMDITIADLPGGNHRGDRPKRIPEGREVIMQAVDAFILLGRADSPEILEGWRAELKRWELEKRVFAEIVSQSPEDALGGELEELSDGMIHGYICGLDRKNMLSEETNAFLNPLLKRMKCL